jgi:hypothetical protein
MNNETHATYSDQAFASVMGNAYIVTGKLSSNHITPIAARLADDMVPRALLAIMGGRVAIPLGGRVALNPDCPPAGR